jgi:hypothetical protein
MARNLTVLIGLSLTVAGLDCNETNDGPDGTAMDACLNEADLGMVCALTFNDDFVTDCVVNAAGSASGTSACLQEDPPGLSPDCADCYGSLIGCVATNCLSAGCIADQDGERCRACIDEAGCYAARDSCRGDLAAACEDF